MIMVRPNLNIGVDASEGMVIKSSSSTNIFEVALCNVLLAFGEFRKVLGSVMSALLPLYTPFC